MVIVVGSIALLPIVGNNITEKFLDEKMVVLTSNGLEVNNTVIESNYLTTKRHYEFLLSDAPRFIEYLNQYSDAQLPPYVDAMADGVSVGVDVEYSNFFFSSKAMIDIYPLSLPTDMMSELKKEDIKFYNYIDSFLKKKGVLYHLNYDISEKSFDGFIKDIDEEYTFDNQVKAIFKIIDATYSGEGSLVAPQNLQVNISKINLDINTSEEDIFFRLSDLSSASTFESQSTYLSSMNIKTLSLLIEAKKSGKTEINIDDMKLNISSNTQGKKAEFYTKSSISKLQVSSLSSNLVASNLNYDISLEGADKDSYEELHTLTSYASKSHSPNFEKEFQASLIKLFSKGLVLSIADLSIATVGVKNKKPVDGFSMMAKLTLAKDVDLAKKLNSSPMSLINNLLLSSTLTFSKDFYALLNKELPASILAGGFAREDAKSVIFDIELKDGRLSVNGKKIL